MNDQLLEQTKQRIAAAEEAFNEDLQTIKKTAHHLEHLMSDLKRENESLLNQMAAEPTLP